MAQPKPTQTSKNYKPQIAALGMGTDWGTLSSIVLCCAAIKGVQLVSLTTSLCSNLRETTVSRNLFNPAAKQRSVQLLTEKGETLMAAMSTGNARDNVN